jgi:hypothetical protein
MMRRVPHSCFMFSSVCVLGILLVVSQLNAGASGQPFLPALASLSPCSQEQILHLLLKSGALEIWDTGSLNVPVNSHFEPQYHSMPAGKPLFTGADLDPKSLSMGQNLITGYYFIKFSMKGAAAVKLTSFTSHNIGSYITITLERVVISSIMLRYTLPGKGQFEMSPHSLALLGIKCA